MSVTVVVGAQYGSEGKGNIVHKMADQFDIHVRTGGPNAGHSFRHNNRTYKQQSLPCGWVNRKAMLVIGAGAIVNPSILKREIDDATKVDQSVTRRVMIDRNAVILSQKHMDAENGVDGKLHRRIGSTGEGVGAARVDRIRRIPGITAGENRDLFEGLNIVDTARVLQECCDSGNILLEGAQGSLLSLWHGGYPYTTSHDTNASQLLADAGLPPRTATRVLLVARTFPIRVAGNSGPLPQETTWEHMSERVGRPLTERTTVTNKVRRIAYWDDEDFAKACRLNGPTHIAVTFLDYWSPQDEGKTKMEDLSSESIRMLTHIGMLANAPIKFVGTGGGNWSVIDTMEGEW